VLVDGATGQKGETAFVSFGHHVAVSKWITTDQVISLNRRAGRAAADDSAAAKHVVKRLPGRGPFVGVDQPPLPAAAKPHAGCTPQRFDEFVPVGLGAVGRMQDRDRLGSRLFQLAYFAAVAQLWILDSGRDDHDMRLRSTGQFDELSPHLLGQPPATNDHQ